MGKRKGGGGGGCADAMALYERALEALDDEREDDAVGALEESAAALAREPRGGVRDELAAEVNLALGRLLEARDSDAARAAYEAAFENDGSCASALGAARCAWASGGEAARGVEALLARAVKAGGDACAREAAADDAAGVESPFGTASSDDARDAREHAGRFFLARGRRREAAAALDGFGYERAFSGGALDGSLAAAAPPVVLDGGAPVVLDGFLPPAYARGLARALAPGSRYYRENDYGGPATPFFSFSHRLPAWGDRRSLAPSSVGINHCRPGISSNPSTSLKSNAFSMILEPLIQSFPSSRRLKRFFWGIRSESTRGEGIF